MRRIRKDLVGVVMAGSQTFAAGEEIPDDLQIAEDLLDPTTAPKKPSKQREAPSRDDEEDFSDLLAPAEETKPAPKTRKTTRRRTSKG